MQTNSLLGLIIIIILSLLFIICVPDEAKQSKKLNFRIS